MVFIRLLLRKNNFTAIIFGIIICFLAYGINSIPIETFDKIVPLCYIPGANCKERFNNLKMYLFVFFIVVLLAVLGGLLFSDCDDDDE